MTKNIMIDYDLYMDLVKYHCYGGCFETEEMHQSISNRLMEKLDKLARHQEYSKNFKKAEE